MGINQLPELSYLIEIEVAKSPLLNCNALIIIHLIVAVMLPLPSQVANICN